jgi:hypothetical protein
MNEEEKEIERLSAENAALKCDNAKLRGAVWALERQLDAMRAAPAPQVPPVLWPMPVAPYPIGPTPGLLPTAPPYLQPSIPPFNPLAGHGGNCACPQCVPRSWGTAGEPVGLPAGCVSVLGGGVTWVGETKAVFGGPPGVPAPSDLRFATTPGSH